MSDSELIALIIGLFLIISYSVRYFNQPLYNYAGDEIRYRDLILPIQPRMMTEFAAYRFYRHIFIGVMIVVYGLLVYALLTLGAAGPIDQGGLDERIINLLAKNKIITIVGSALLVIGLTRYPKWFADMVGEFRKILHEQARIPLKGRELFNKLLYLNINYENEVSQACIKNLLSDNPIEPGNKRLDLEREDFKNKNRKDVIWKWAKLSYLLCCLKEYMESGVVGKHEADYNLGWRGLWSEYVELMDDIIEYRNPDSEMSKEEVSQIREDVRKLLYKTCRIIACLLILSAKPETGPEIWLEEYGYEIQVERRKWISLKNVFIVALVVMLSITISTFIFGAIYEGRHGDVITTTPLQLLRHNIHAAVIFIFPVLLVIYVKRRLSVIGIWSAVHEGSQDKSFTERQWLIYFGIALIGWVLVNILMTLIVYMQTDNTALLQRIVMTSRTDVPEGSLGGIITGAMKVKSGSADQFGLLFRAFWPFSFIAFITILFAAYRVDIPPLLFKSPLRFYVRHIAFALFQGGATALTVYLAFKISSIDVINPVKQEFYYLLAFVAGAAMNVGFQFGKHTYVHADARTINIPNKQGHTV